MKEIKKVQIMKYASGKRLETEDCVAVEEPLEMRLVFDRNGESIRRSVAVTMRTPGNDSDLVRGFFIGEKIIEKDEIENIEVGENIVTVFAKQGVDIHDAKFTRNFFMTSSCGVCGKAALDDLTLSGFEKIVHTRQIQISMLLELSHRSLEKQWIFEKTGGLHAASAFTCDGDFLAIAEDVGRHNAFDKLLGILIANDHRFEDTVIFLSGRVSFELVQKAISFRVPFLAAVGAPSSLAIQTAEAFNVGVAGFLGENRVNIYSGFDNFL